MENYSDDHIITEIQKGHIEKFEMLVRKYQSGLVKFVFTIVKDFPQAEDIVQETFIKIYRNIPELDSGKKFSAYLFTIAKNQSITYLRQKKETVSLENIDIADENEDTVNRYVINNLIDIIKQKIKFLPDTFTQILTLYYFEELSYLEISKKLDLPINTVKTRLRRAKIQLRKIAVL